MKLPFLRTIAATVVVLQGGSGVALVYGEGVTGRVTAGVGGMCASTMSQRAAD